MNNKMNSFFMVVVIFGVIFQQAIKVSAIDPKTIKLYMVDAPADGAEAHTTCAGLNLKLYGNEDEQAHGVIVDNVDFQRYLVKQIESLGWVTNPSVAGDAAWIGLERKADGEFYWADGTKLAAGDFSDWSASQPGTGNCVFMDLFDQGKWFTHACDSATATVIPKGAICQYSRASGEDVAFSFYGATVTWALIIVVAVIVGIIVVIRCVSCSRS